MIRLHDEEHGGGEPVPGLPSGLPEGETLLWQGRPGMMAFAVHVFHIRFVAGYFFLVTLWRLANAVSGNGSMAAGEILPGAVSGLVIAAGLLLLLAWAMTRATVYTITSRRIVMRYGVAIRKYVNLPFDQIQSAGLRQYGQHRGDIELSLSDARSAIGYLKLWPHVRPFRFSRPRPMLRGLQAPGEVAQVLARAISAHAPDRVTVSRIPARPGIGQRPEAASASGLVQGA